MIGASKILTVSYGTFSCTLEGFDDPFNTMKAIAEYFRDLAADDRYFGAEPPTPDAAMLSRIAEREVQRRVEAKVDDTGVILRASDIAAPAQPMAPQPAPVAAPHSALLADESVAAKLQRIRAAVARSAAMAPAPVIEDAVFAEDEQADVLHAPMPEPAPTAPEPAVQLEPVADAPIVELRDAWEDIDAAADAAKDEAEAIEVAAAEEQLREVFETVVVPEPVAEDVAATADLIADQDLPEAQPDLSAIELPEEIEADSAAEDALIASLAAEPAPEPEAVHDATPEGDDTVSSILATLVETTEPEAEAAPAEAVFTDAASFEAEKDEAEAFAIDADEDVTPYAEAPAVTVDEEVAFDDAIGAAVDAVPAEAQAEVEDMPEVAAVAQAEFEEEPEAPAPAMEWDEVAEADDRLVLVEDDRPTATEADATWPADPETPAVEAPQEADLSDKLRRARERVIKVRRPEPLLLTEAETAPLAAAPATAEDEAEAARRSEGEGRTILESAPKADEDVTRLLRQTNSEMEGPESKRRMSTLAHLKAAVAATVAELRAPSPSAGTGEPSRLERYRADLARVVRPKRNEDTPVTERPAPLVLVSEQRIDRPSNTDASPTRIMPRRVASNGNLALSQQDDISLVGAEFDSDADNIFASSKNFAEFAERLGAHDLPDLLEAAAAYTACVEGRESFSRPHLMRHVSAVTSDRGEAREDSMRSFGQLLRQGKIAKVKRGQFTITDSSYFLAEARRMTR